MANNLVEIIFNQFLDILEKVANKKYCIDIDKCDYNYHIRNLAKVQLIDVITKVKGRCRTVKTVGITIDYTSICLEHLPTKKWKQYLKKLALELLCEIIEDKVFIIPGKEYKKKCREQPKWCAFPTQCTTVITKKCKPKKVEPKCKIIFENRCECIPVCKRVKIQPERKIIVRCAPQKSYCSDNDFSDEENDRYYGNNNNYDNNNVNNYDNNNYDNYDNNDYDNFDNHSANDGHGHGH